MPSNAGSWDELRGELGDLLLQVVFHAQIADDEGLFRFDDVANAIADKMVARHPHVFGDESARQVCRAADGRCRLGLARPSKITEEAERLHLALQSPINLAR